jgi:Ig-like domain-containing protein
MLFGRLHYNSPITRQEDLMRRFSKLAAGIALITAVLACNLPSNQPQVQGPSAILTAAALTVQAQVASAPAPAATPTFTSVPAPLPTVPLPTLPPPASPTSNCDNAQFITDVTYPDNTVVAPGTNFTKIWRLKNVGVCSWTPSYAVVFFSGEQMSGPSAQALAGNVNPGQTIDISVNLTAPGSNGTKVGYWKLRNASGITFAQFYVQIKVQGGGGGSAQTTTLTGLSGEDGYVLNDGTVFSFPNVGDTAANKTAEAFVSFDLSSIPDDATITKVVVKFTDYDTLGDPFSISDGCLRAYVQGYGTLDAGDFFAGDPTGAVIRWCGTSDLDSSFEDPDMISILQGEIDSPRLQLRLQFRTPTTNGNGVADMVRFGVVKLTVTYTTP